MADLEALALKLVSSEPFKVEDTPRRVRALLDGDWLFDTISARHVWENQHYPLFWVPVSSFAPGVLTKGKAVNGAGRSAFLGTVKGGAKSTDRVLIFEDGPLAGYVRVEYKAVDVWFEEDQPIYGHPKNPYTRIDILPSSRKIEVRIGGVTVAEASNPKILFETGLRPRFYLPKSSVQLQYLSLSDTKSLCPYKGLAEYYNVNIGGKEYTDHVWWYRYPTSESADIQGLVSFYNEKVAVYIDGVLEKM